MPYSASPPGLISPVERYHLRPEAASCRRINPAGPAQCSHQMFGLISFYWAAICLVEASRLNQLISYSDWLNAQVTIFIPEHDGITLCANCFFVLYSGQFSTRLSAYATGLLAIPCPMGCFL
jgi:hypothetical protein